MNNQLLVTISENLSWIFEGIGTEIICSIASLIVGALVGGVAGYKIGVKNRISQKQKAGEKSVQKQVGSVNIYYDKK